MEAFLKKSHNVNGNTVQIEYAAKLSDAASGAEQSNTLKICSEHLIDADVLEMYLQSSKSGGGDNKVVEWVKKIEDGVYHAKFESLAG